MNDFFTCVLPRPGRSERGVALVAVLYALSIFSVLSLTVLRNADLEKTLRTAEDPDLHVVLYAGGAGSRTVIGRLNLPTIWRNQGGPDRSTEVRVPGAPGLDLASELSPGWAYAVRLSPNARVCCDGGDNACSNVTWDQEIAEGSLTPALERPLNTTGPTHSLHFALSSLAVPEDVVLDSSATAESGFMVRATRLREGSSAPTVSASQSMTCKLESADAAVVTGTLQIQPGTDERQAITRISSGTLELKYRAPGAPR
ncbi:MAG: hypothetical protein LC804_16580 [Acidobacteria bacterium]|nr:hypothetical protein [Acidobacteriota bacterium]